MNTELAAQDLVAFAPELVLCVAIVFFLVVRLFNRFTWVHLGWVALGMTVALIVVTALLAVELEPLARRGRTA